MVATAGYVVKPPRTCARPMFSPSDYDIQKAKALTLSDFLPTPEAHDTMTSAFKLMIWFIVKKVNCSNDIDVPDLNYSMPKIFQLNHHESSEIYGLPTYDLNEGIINEVIDIHKQIVKAIGLLEAQGTQNIIMFKGDLATVLQNR